MLEPCKKIGKKGIDLCQKHLYLTVLLICLVAGTCCSVANPTLTGWCCVVGAILLGVCIVVRIIRKTLTDAWSGILLWGIGFLVRLELICRQPYTQMQHDIGTFTGEPGHAGPGHAGYISYLLWEGHLPDFDVRSLWQYYQPPLHHSITALWMHILDLFGMDMEQIYECSQVLPFAYSCLAMVIFSRLLKCFHIKGIPYTLMFGCMALHPAFIIPSGSINNDMPSILLMMAALLLTVRWYREPKLSTILKLALAIGLGMMTKLSAWLAAPAAAMVFLVILWRNRRKPLPYIKQFVAFGCVCVPLGLGWGVRNLIKFGVPITYIPMLSSNSPQYVGRIPVLQRLFDFSPKQFSYIYDCFSANGQEYNEYNPLIGLMKTAVFEEFVNTKRYPAVAGMGEVLFWIQVVLAALAFAALIWMCRKSELAVPERIALLLTYGFTLISYISFCIAFPHTCTQSIRYAVPVIYVTLLCLGMLLQKSHPLFRRITAAVSCIFMASSFLIYGVLIYRT